MTRLFPIEESIETIYEIITSKIQTEELKSLTDKRDDPLLLAYQRLRGVLFHQTEELYVTSIALNQLIEKIQEKYFANKNIK